VVFCLQNDVNNKVTALYLAMSSVDSVYQSPNPAFIGCLSVWFFKATKSGPKMSSVTATSWLVIVQFEKTFLSRQLYNHPLSLKC